MCEQVLIEFDMWRLIALFNNSIMLSAQNYDCIKIVCTNFDKIRPMVGIEEETFKYPFMEWGF